MFHPNSTYLKSDIYRILNVPVDKQRGAWDTGYREYNDSFYIFANVGVAGRTGHDYDNRFEGSDFIWYGKVKSSLKQPLIKKMLLPNSSVHIFTRTDDRAPFSYNGLGKVKEVVDSTPVQVTWTIVEPQLFHLDEIWQALRYYAVSSLEAKDSFYSLKTKRRYEISDVRKQSIKIKSTTPGSTDTWQLAPNTLTPVVQILNESNGSILKGKLHKEDVLEQTIVWLLPNLDWDDTGDNILVIRRDIQESTRLYPQKNIVEAQNDVKKEITRWLRERRGQSKLRSNLFDLYQEQCCMSGFGIKDALHACHISPHSESGNNNSTNALLLRSDIHDLFDANLIGINPNSFTIELKPSLLHTEYARLNGKKLAARADKKTPDKKALEERWRLFNSNSI